MVEEEITDGRRIAELLASELDGRRGGGLDRVAVVDPNADVTPTADGARAYDVHCDGDSLARVFVHPESARIAFHVDAAAFAADIDAAGVPDDAVENGVTAAADRNHLVVPTAAATKRATDAVQAIVTNRDE
jgi:hypothetical protein